MEELTGTVKSVIFRNEMTGYTVCTVAVGGRDGTVTVVGNTPTVWVGETLNAEGRWSRHKQHGQQFQATAMHCVAPTSTRGIERYLASGMIRGIGKVMASRLVAKFGKETLRVIEKESKRLTEVEGIGPKRRNLIKESWIEQKAVRDIMIFLQSHGVGTAQSARIYRKYGSDAIARISENPYRLSNDIWGIGFKTADGVAMSIGIDMNSPLRARAGLHHVLQTMTEEGHCFCPSVELLLQAQALLDITAEALSEALNHELSAGQLVRDDDHIYLPNLHAAEMEVSAKIVSILQTPAPFRPIVADKAVEWAARQMRIDFADAQADALRIALTGKLSIITGGPGVGKTTIIRALVDVFTARRLTVCLAAPTGRAAKRMNEATHHEAKTIHRLLRFLPHLNRFEHDADNLLEGDIFILDEVSMIDLPLMNHFLRAVPDRSCVVLVGDTDQLPSVGPGNVLKDLIESEIVPCCELDTIFRQKTGGWIVRNAHHVNAGEFIEEPTNDAESDFFFIAADEPEQAIHCVCELVTRRIPKRFGFDALSDVQVLTPMRKNQLGADNLNHVLQEALNPTGPEVQRFGHAYRVDDRVMQIRNNYDKDVYNGDIGAITSIDTVDQIVTVLFDDRRIAYELAELDELVHAYACSIHKSQGSEYPAVVILLATQHFKLLQRNLLYTAITRGKRLVCLVGSRKAINIAIRNNEIQLRRTGLRERIKESNRG